VTAFLIASIFVQGSCSAYLSIFAASSGGTYRYGVRSAFVEPKVIPYLPLVELVRYHLAKLGREDGIPSDLHAKDVGMLELHRPCQWYAQVHLMSDST
jgi:hypothetical protein